MSAGKKDKMEAQEEITVVNLDQADANGDKENEKGGLGSVIWERKLGLMA